MARYTAEFGEAFDKLLAVLARGRQIPKSEVIRRAVATYAFLGRHVDSEPGARVSLTDADERVVKHVALP